MALKDVTLGQFFPGSTFLHRLDPRTKLLLVIFYIVALFCAKNIAGYALCALVLFAGAVSSKVGFKALFKGLKPIFMILIITGVLNLLYTVGEGEPLVSFWIINIYWEGIRTAFFMVIRIMMLISCTFLLTYTTSPIRLTDAIEELLGPLKKLRMPVHELAMIMSIALRFIPLLIEETDKIMSAQKARGADFETGNLIQRAKSLIPLLVPLFISAFRRADELATAMECRCYHGGEGRTRMLQLKYALRDYVALLLGACLCAGIFGLNLLGVF